MTIYELHLAEPMIVGSWRFNVVRLRAPDMDKAVARFRAAFPGDHEVKGIVEIDETPEPEPVVSGRWHRRPAKARREGTWNRRTR